MLVIIKRQHYVNIKQCEDRVMTYMKLYLACERLGYFASNVHNIGAGGVDSGGSINCTGLSLKRLLQVSRRQIKRMG